MAQGNTLKEEVIERALEQSDGRRRGGKRREKGRRRSGQGRRARDPGHDRQAGRHGSRRCRRHADEPRDRGVHGGQSCGCSKASSTCAIAPPCTSATPVQAGLHHLMYEIVDNSIDEVLAGRANEIWVVLNKDKSISVRDDGNGIPTDINTATGLSGVELAMTKLNAGGKFGDGGYKVSGRPARCRSELRQLPVRVVRSDRRAKGPESSACAASAASRSAAWRSSASPTDTARR